MPFLNPQKQLDIDKILTYEESFLILYFMFLFTISSPFHYSVNSIRVKFLENGIHILL